MAVEAARSALRAGAEEVTVEHTIMTDPSTMRTNVEKIYAGGDLTSGPRSVIQAVDSGRRAAETIHRELTGNAVSSPTDGRVNFSRGRKFEAVDMANFAGRAIRLRESIPSRPPERRINDFDQVELGYNRGVCTYCGTGYSLDLRVKNDVLIEIRADVRQPPNHGDLCIKGRFGHDFHRHGERLTHPLVRETIDDPFRKASWEEALAIASTGFKKALAKCGPTGVGVLSSSRCENEVNFVAQKFARITLKTNNIDNCARVCHAPSVSGLRVALGSGAATNSLNSIEQAKVLLICGANTGEAHPVVGMKIKRAVKNGARLIVIDPRRTGMADLADIWLKLIPGTNVPLLYCIGYDPVHTQGNANEVKKAFAEMDMVVVQDIFPTETAKMAHVVLPAACFYEKDGTFTNAERRVRRIRKAVNPPGDALPD